jgi:hypothetical protein
VAGHDRELRSVRISYLGAVRELDQALRAFDTSDIPLDPGPGAVPIPWSRQQEQIIRDVADAFRAVIDRRRSWDAMRKEWRDPH